MSAKRFYRGLGALALAIAAAAAGLATLGLLFTQPSSAGAAGLCAAVFIVPGFAFVGYARRLSLRETALKHIAAKVESQGVLQLDELSDELGIPLADATKVVKTAVREGYAKGAWENARQFVAPTAHRCPSCRAPLRKDLPVASCGACGLPIPG